MSDFHMFVTLAFLAGMYCGLFAGAWAERRDTQSRRREW